MEKIQTLDNMPEKFYIFTEEERNLMKRFAKGELSTKEFRKLALNYLKIRRESK